MDQIANKDGKNLLKILVFLILLWPRPDCTYLCRFSLQLHWRSRRTSVISEPQMRQKIKSQRTSNPNARLRISQVFLFLVWSSEDSQLGDCQATGYLGLSIPFCSDFYYPVDSSRLLLSCGLPWLSHQESFSCKWPKPRSNGKELWAQRTERSLSWIQN